MEIYTVYFAPYPNTRMVTCPDEFDIFIDGELMNYSINSMRCPIIHTNELSVLNIYEEKQEFDLFLSSCYRENAICSSKFDVVQGLFQDGKRIRLNSTWENAYAALNYIDVFIRHLSVEEQTFSEDVYIVRTFEDFVIDGSVIHTAIGDFSGDVKDVLLHASGTFKAKEIAERCDLSVKRLEEIFDLLNDRCLVYASLW